MSSTSYLRQVKGITWLLQLKAQEPVTKKFKGMVLCREDTQISHSFQYSHYKQKGRALSYCTGLVMVAKEAEKMCHLCNQGASCPIYSIWVKWRMTTLDGGRWSSSKSVVPCMGQFTTLTQKVLSHEATCRHDTSPWQITSCDMYVFMQFDAGTCHMNSNQLEFMQIHVVVTKCCTHIWSPLVTCPCDMLLR